MKARLRGEIVAHMAGDTRLDFVEHGDRRADLARGAIAALVAIMPDERGLQRMQRIGRAQSFDGRDIASFVHDRQSEAGVDTLSVEDHRAGAALAMIAPFLCSGEMQVFAQRIEQRGPRVEFKGTARAVDRM